MKWLIDNARLVDPATGNDTFGALAIADGRIVAHYRCDDPLRHAFAADRVFDAAGAVVAPALIDSYARLRGPVFEPNDRLEAELRAAVAGGIAHVVVAPDTDPPLDEPGLVEMLLARAARLGLAQPLPLGALTLGLHGERLAEMARLARCGCIGFSQGDVPMRDTLALLRAMQYAASFDFPVWLSAIDPDLSPEGGAHDGMVAARLGLTPIPVAAETVALTRLLELAHEAQVRLHLVNLSSARAVMLLRQAKAQGLAVTASVSALHLAMTELDIDAFDANAHVVPPLRSQRDRDALAEAVADGTIEVITSNHTAVGSDAKAQPFAESAPGAAGLETLLGLTLRWGEALGLDLPATLAPVTTRAAQLLGRSELGHLGVGARADLVVFDPHRDWIVNTDTLVGPGRNTPWSGLPLKGWIRATFVDGNLVWQRG